MMIFTVLLSGAVMVFTPLDDTPNNIAKDTNASSENALAESNINLTIPYVDTHYGKADGIIDPTEYSVEYTDPITGITVHMEHNGTVLFVGLEADTSGWIAIGWKNYTSNFASEGLNGSDLIYGYAPGEPHTDVQRVTEDDFVTVHYELIFRNGTVFQQGNAPTDDSTTPIGEEGLLQDYKDQIIGMRIGETRHFIIPAERGYTRPTDALYGEDLEYIITLTRINADFTNPADSSDIVFSDEYGISTYQHLADSNQNRIISANGSDDGTHTQLEYFIEMNSDDVNDIPLFNSSNAQFPFTLIFGADEDINDLPEGHSSFAEPIMTNFEPNAVPNIEVINPEQNASIEWVANLIVDATDNTYVRSVDYQIDDEGDWTPLTYDFKTSQWTAGAVDTSVYTQGAHFVTFRAMDPSNATGYSVLNFTIDRPFIPVPGIRLEVSRTVKTELYQATTVSDVFTVRNNGSAPIGAIEIYLPDEYSTNIMSVFGTDSDGNSLSIIQLGDSNGFMRWRVYFFKSVGYDESYTFTVISAYHSLTTLKNFDGNLYQLDFLRYPVVPYVLSKASLTIDFRSGDSLAGDSVDSTDTNIEPMTVVPFTLEEESFTPYIIGYRTTKISLDAWGWLNYKETVTVHNIGPARENTLLFTVPAYSTAVKIYDQVGVLASSQPGDYNWNETLALQINLRSDRFGVDGFWPGYSYTFFITYSIQLASHQEVVSTGNKLDVPIATMGTLLIVEHQVDLVIPYSVGVADITDGYRPLYGVFDNTYRYMQYNETLYNPLQISVTYQVSLAVFARPLLFSCIIGLIALAYVSLRKVEIVSETFAAPDEDTEASIRTTGAPPELIRKFATLYSRKTSLNIDLEKLETARRRGKVKQREFRIRERDIKSQLEDIDSELPSVRDELLVHGSRYRDMIGHLELENEKIEGAKAGLRQLLRRKKKAQISRAAFEKIRQDYLKTIKKSTTATDRIILSLQEEAGDL
jgi:hypothetical protein